MIILHRIITSMISVSFAVTTQYKLTAAYGSWSLQPLTAAARGSTNHLIRANRTSLHCWCD